MNRKVIVCLLTAALLSTAPSVEAQQSKKLHRIGYLLGASSSFYTARIDALQQGLRELGYIEGRILRLSTDMRRGRLNVFRPWRPSW